MSDPLNVTSLFYRVAADLTLGIGVFVTLSCLVGAVLLFDSWREERRDTPHVQVFTRTEIPQAFYDAFAEERKHL